MPTDWEMTVDSIKTKAQSLVVQNDGLQIRYRRLMEEAQKLQQAIIAQQHRNEQLSHFLQNRHGRTDQQLQIEELTERIKVKKPQAAALEGLWRTYQHKQSSLQAAIREQTAPDDEMSQLRKQLETENKQEALLNNQLESLRTGTKMQVLKQHTAGDARKYDKLNKRKEELEASIQAYELRMDQLRQSSLSNLVWPSKKKELVHEMAELDARNNGIRDNIKGLKEDIDVLKDQVAKLERRLNFMQGKDIK